MSEQPQGEGHTGSPELILYPMTRREYRLIRWIGFFVVSLAVCGLLMMMGMSIMHG